MNTIACATALSNLRKSIAPDRHFPLKVFSGHWRDFYFFDSDWMFDGGVVEQLKSLLAMESGVCACLVDLDRSTENDKSELPPCVDRETTAAEYQSFLHGNGPEDGWIYTADRFAWASDRGLWCIYAERRNEIAVLAFKANAPTEHCTRIIDQFKGLPIKEALERQQIYGFSSRAMSQQWRDSFAREYVGVLSS